jgi:hypothetical protein
MLFVVLAMKFRLVEDRLLPLLALRLRGVRGQWLYAYKEDHGCVCGFEIVHRGGGKGVVEPPFDGRGGGAEDRQGGIGSCVGGELVYGELLGLEVVVGVEHGWAEDY